MIKLSETQLESLIALARRKNFSEAARECHLSQPAFSRRIQALEGLLGSAVAVRTPSGVEITAIGSKVLQHAQNVQSLEAELLHDLSLDKRGELGGLVRIAGYSSVAHPVVIPLLSPFLRKNPSIQLELMVRDCKQVAPLLIQSRADFAITDETIARSDIESTLLGYEHFVWVKLRDTHAREDIFLDVAPEDSTTEQYFMSQGKSPKTIRRSFMNDEIGISYGLENGLGSAIRPSHLLPKQSKKFVIVNPKHKLKKPVYLNYRRMNYYPKIILETRDILLRELMAYFSRSRLS